MKHALICIALATPVFAEEPLDGDAFERLVEGKTITFSTPDGPYGVEYYAPNRQVIWSYIGAECQNGEWEDIVTDQGPVICFTYDDQPAPQCWQFFDIDGKIRADFVNSPGFTVLYEATVSEPLVCGGVGA